MTSIEIYLTKNANGPLNPRPAKNGQPGNGNWLPPMPLLNPQGEGRGWGALGRDLYNGIVTTPLKYWGQHGVWDGLGAADKELAGGAAGDALRTADQYWTGGAGENAARGTRKALNDAWTAAKEVPGALAPALNTAADYWGRNGAIGGIGNAWDARKGIAAEGLKQFESTLPAAQKYWGDLDRKHFGGYLKPVARTGLGIVGELATAPLGAVKALNWGSKAIRGGLSAANAARAGAGLGLGTLYQDIGNGIGTGLFDYMAGDSINGYGKTPTAAPRNAVDPTARGQRLLGSNNPGMNGVDRVINAARPHAENLGYAAIPGIAAKAFQAGAGGLHSYGNKMTRADLTRNNPFITDEDRLAGRHLPVNQKAFNRGLADMADSKGIPAVVTYGPYERYGAYSQVRDPLDIENDDVDRIMKEMRAKGVTDDALIAARSRRYNPLAPAMHINLTGDSVYDAAHELGHHTNLRQLRRDLHDATGARPDMLQTYMRQDRPNVYDDTLKEIRSKGGNPADSKYYLRKFDVSPKAPWYNRHMARGGYNTEDSTRGRRLGALGKIQAGLQSTLGVDPYSATGMALNFGIPLAQYSPELLEEYRASRKALKYARDPRIGGNLLTPKQHRWGKAGLAGALGTYLAKPLLDGATNHAISSLSNAYDEKVQGVLGYGLTEGGRYLKDWLNE